MLCEDKIKDLVAVVVAFARRVEDMRNHTPGHLSDAYRKFPLACDDHGPYCPTCLAGPHRINTEHRPGCELKALLDAAEGLRP